MFTRMKKLSFVLLLSAACLAMPVNRYGKPETVAYPLGFSIKSLKVTHVDCDSHSSPAAIDHRAESLPRQDLLLKTIGICGNAGIQRVSPSPCATVWPMTRRW